MPLSAKPSIYDITPYVAGKSKATAGQRIIKLSSNENQFGASPRALEAYQHQAATLFRYPDSGHLELREAIAAVYNLPASQLICGAGSDELIGMIVQAYTQAGDEVLYPEHGFLMYRIYALAQGAVPKTAPETQYKTNVDALLAAVTPKTKIVFVANPNNPTGSYLTKQEMHRLRRELPESVLLVIDDAYSEYVTNTDYSTGEELVTATQNTVMLRTFSKIYGLPALRVGWGYAPASVIDVLNRIRGPFNLNSPAIAAAIAAVQDTEYLTFVRDTTNRERQRVATALAPHFKVHPSVGNFILVDFGSSDRAQQANQFLLQQGIIVRDVAAYGLATCLRITIGTEEENTMLLQALEKFSFQHY
jgi:histidinol-phosphate aminotransferase